MGYNPNEPRDMYGKWTDGGASQKSSKGNQSLIDRISTQHQRDTAGAVLRGAATGVAEGIVASVVIGAVTGGFGVGAAPALIARGIARGAIAGAKLHPAHIAVVAGVGAGVGLAKHRESLKSHVAAQHKKG